MNGWRLARTLLALGMFVIIAGGASRASRVSDIAPPRAALPKLVRTGEAELTVSAEGILIERLTTGEELFVRAADERLPIASLTKLMTALVLAEHSRPLDEITFSADAKQAGEPDDKRSSVPAGERLRAEDVARMLMISSDTDAAYAAAEHVILKRDPALLDAEFTTRIGAFVGLMNQRAFSLGLADTRFANPSGQDDPENYSSARDLARLADAIRGEHPELWSYSRTAETFIFGAAGQRYGLVNTNPLLLRFPAIFGSKTGFEDEARGTLVVLYEIARGDPVAIVLLRSRARASDGEAAIRWLEANFQLESK